MASSFLALCVVLSDPISAHVLYRLLYWLRRNPDKKDGLHWIANPSSWWASQTGLSPHQIDRAMKNLEALGLIVIEKAPQWKQKILRCRWIRLSDYGREMLLANSPDKNSDSSGKPSKQPATDLTQAQEHIAKDSSKEAKKEETICGAHPQITPDTKEEEEGVGEGLSVSAFEAVWKKTERAMKEGWVAPFSFKEREWAAELIKNAEDQDLASAIVVVVREWADFTNFVAESKKLQWGQFPLWPNVLFVLQHLSEVFDFAEWHPKYKAAHQAWEIEKSAGN